MSVTPVTGITEMVDSQLSPYLAFNEALRILEVHAAGGIISRTLAAEPSLVDGAAYILPASPTGTNWAAFAEHDLVIAIGGIWRKFTPLEGWGFWVNDADEHVDFNGTNWEAVASGGGSSYAVAYELITATRVLSESDKENQFIKTTVARTIELPAAPVTDLRFVIYNISSYTAVSELTVKVTGDTNYFTKIYTGSRVEFIYDLETALWYCFTGSGVRTRTAADTYDTNDRDIGIGRDADCRNQGIAIGALSSAPSSVAIGYAASSGGVAIGTSASAGTNGVAVGKSTVAAATSTCVGGSSSASSDGVSVGYSAVSATYGVAIGRSCTGSDGVGIGGYANGSSGIAIGQSATVSSRGGAIALGKNATATRIAELCVSIDLLTTDQANYGTMGFYRTTTNATPVEMKLGNNDSSGYAYVKYNSVMSFKIQVAARDNTSGDCAAYEIVGAIKNNAGTVSFVGVPVVTVIAEDDASWDVGVSLNTTQDALAIDVTGDATNTVQWAAACHIIETQF